MKTSILFSLLVILTIQNVLADVINTSTSKHYGKITSITNSFITIKEGCQNTTVKITWAKRTSVIFNPDCKPPKVGTSSAPLLLPEPNCNKTMIFMLKLKNEKSIFYCNSVSYDGSNFELSLHDGRRYLLQDFVNNKNIDYLSYSSICTDKIEPPEQIPHSLKSIPASCTISLRAPVNNAVFNQYTITGGQVNTTWQFSWLSCPGATKYRLYVIHPKALNGWTWKVKAYVGGQWGKWSEIRTFDVSPPPSAISGYISGPLQGEYHNNVGGEHYTMKFEKVILTTPDGKKVMEATLHNREYRFNNVPAGKTYRIYPDSRFLSNPPYIEILNTRPNTNYRKSFRIIGVKPSG
jgi:hypothetical protein